MEFVELVANSPTSGTDDAIVVDVDGDNEDETSDIDGSLVVDAEADEDANATDQRHGCKSRNVPMGLSSRERRA